MDKTRLGKTELMVSRPGFGGIPIQRVSEDEAVAVVKKCLELGITFLDTANGYTTSEERIGKAIKGHRDELVLATKSLSRRREKVREHIELSLKHLGVDYIDLFQIHNVADEATLEKVYTPDGPSPDGPLAAALEAKEKGLIGHIGATTHNWDLAQKIVESGYVETIQVPFNIVTCEAAEQLLPLARKHDVGFIAMKPLAGGMLDENVNLAIKYLFQFSDVVPIPGIEQPHQIEEIVRILEESKQITQADRDEMQALRDRLGTRFCRRCDYCQPCSAEIPISLVLQGDGFYKRMTVKQVATGWVADAMEKAALCTECGDCEERCPYNLPIREMIKEQATKHQEWRSANKELIATL